MESLPISALPSANIFNKGTTSFLQHIILVITPLSLELNYDDFPKFKAWKPRYLQIAIVVFFWVKLRIYTPFSRRN